MSIRKYGRSWALYDDAGELVCVCLYKRGAPRGARLEWMENPSGSSREPVSRWAEAGQEALPCEKAGPERYWCGAQQAAKMPGLTQMR